MHFKSDNTARVSPEIMDALIKVNEAPYATPYGGDDWSAALRGKLSEIFEREVAVYPCATGSAANSLGLSALTPPYGAIYCHEKAHIHVDETGASELFSGAKLMTFPGGHGKLSAESLVPVIEAAQLHRPHTSKPATINVTQATESGTVYTLEELEALGELARRYELGFHMDGARFSNALVHLGVTPAEMTWKAGVDMLSLGMTKNGALCADAVVIFNPKYAENFDYIHKRGGQLISKMRFFAAQFLAAFEEDRWLSYARHANHMAQQLAQGITQVPGVALLYPVEANELFVSMPKDLAERLWAAGAQFYPWGDHYRLVCSFVTQASEVEAFVACALGS